MKKICFFSGDITRSGGTERVSAMIANELVKCPEYQVVFLSLVEQKEEPFFKLDSRIERFALGKKWLSPGPAYLPLIPKLRAFLKAKQIDLIIDIDIVLDILSVPAALGRKTKVLSWEHSNCEFELQHGYRRVILKLFTKRTNWIVTLTPGDARHFQKEMGREDRISAIFNPIPLCQELPCVQRENAIVTVARLVPEKGFEYLAKVAEIVLKANPEWKWYLCGDGPEREKLEAFRESKELQNQLILCGLVPKVEDYLLRSKLFVLTSKAEGLPMCLLEARAMGVPCVSFDIPTGPSDIIEDGVNGYLVKPFDCEDMAQKVNCLLQSPELLAEMGRQASSNLEPFGMEQVIGKWRALINQLLER